MWSDVLVHSFRDTEIGWRALSFLLVLIATTQGMQVRGISGVTVFLISAYGKAVPYLHM